MTDIARRSFLGTALVAAAAGVIGDRDAAAADAPNGTKPTPGKIQKSLKFGMVNAPGTLADKFRMLKEIGFDGVELDSPTPLDKTEILKARDASGLVIN